MPCRGTAINTVVYARGKLNDRAEQRKVVMLVLCQHFDCMRQCNYVLPVTAADCDIMQLAK